MTWAYVAAGTNLGDRWAHLALARAELGGRPSPVYESAPVGGPPQGAYLNGVIELEWDATPEALLDRCRAVEVEARRQRRVRWGPRTLDLDVIAVGHERRDQPGLQLPHPRALLRAFVVRPLLDLTPRGIPFDSVRLLAARRDTADQELRLAGPWPKA